MAPIQEVDFPTLSDKIFQVLCEIWTFVRDLALVLWSYVSQASWAVWTYPPFETFRNGLVAAWIAWMNFVFTHPIITVILAFIVVPWLSSFALHCLGVRERGVLRGSNTTNYQSTRYGGNVPARDSMFAEAEADTGASAVGGAGWR
ncbi:hypothetical protein HD554DRAFT_2038948 [Boletus coccyginus]|nr:hypothetical protein HD554DRAFT_2038948 [Boletus coccyginus]